MKKFSLALGLIAMCFLSGCSDKSSSGKRTTTRNNRGAPVVSSNPDGSGNVIDNPENQLPQGQVLLGEIYDTPDNLDDFQDHTDTFVSSFMDPDYIDYDYDEFGVYGASTGISFGAAVEFNNISYTPGMSLSPSTVINTTNAELRISIFDDLVGTEYTDDNGDRKIYTEVPMDFSELNQASSKIVNGQQMLFVFKDVYGEVAFSSLEYGGIINYNGQAYFQGVFYYRNFTSFTDIPGEDLNQEWQTMGYFTIPACGFFKCN